MDRMELYRDIATRTEGDIYIGVVGPVRTGKSTFIKRFLELLVLPGIENEHARTRVVDEMPQSAAGRTIMTTQPRFVPNEAVALSLGENAHCNVRMVDCVGYLVPGALGHMEGEAPRMVRTPWYDHEIPFEEAAAIGTEKVISEHSTIGIVMTTDGSITELPRESYEEAEARVVSELKATGKPFVLIVNSTEPAGDRAQSLAAELSARYGVSALAMDALHMGARDAAELLEEILLSFPLRLIELRLPGYVLALDREHPLLASVLTPIYEALPQLARVRDYGALLAALAEIPDFSPAVLEEVILGRGEAILRLAPHESVFYRILSDATGCAIGDDYALMSTLSEFASAKRAYDRIAGAFASAKQRGFGMIPPDPAEMELSTPEITEQGSRYGVRLKAEAPAYQIFRVDLGSEVNPIVGSEQQSEALVRHLTDTCESDPAAIWETEIFGKPLYDLVREGMAGKIGRMPDEVQEKLRGTLERMVNDGCNGLICIML